MSVRPSATTRKTAYVVVIKFDTGKLVSLNHLIHSQLPLKWVKNNVPFMWNAWMYFPDTSSVNTHSGETRFKHKVYTQWHFKPNNISGYILKCQRLRYTQLATLKQQNAQCCSLDIYTTILHRTFLYVSMHKGSSSGNQVMYSTWFPHKVPC
jgi:hypothetical protein